MLRNYLVLGSNDQQAIMFYNTVSTAVACLWACPAACDMRQPHCNHPVRLLHA